MSQALSLFLSLSLFLLIGCATREAGWEKKTEKLSFSSSELELLRTEAFRLWEGRVEQDRLEEALSKFELIHSANPEDLNALIFLTRGNYFLADSHISNPDLKLRTYEKAASYGEKAMATNPEFKKRMNQGDKVEDALNLLTQKEVPAIYWTAASLGKWAKASGIAAALKYKTRIKAMIGRVEQLEPNYFYGAVPRYWGGYYAVAPSFAGGDLKKSYENFNKSLSMSPGYLGTKVLMADVYWTKKGNKKEFEKTLRSVLQAKDDVIPELRPENMMEKKKAEKLLENMDELF
jgi:tetratricopeptide (TPR) repeat protein